MSRKIQLDVGWQNFWKKAIETEAETRLRWSKKYDPEFQELLRNPDLQQIEIEDNRFCVDHNITRIQHPSTAYTNCSQFGRKTFKPPPPSSPPSPSEDVQQLALQPDMTPPDAATRQLLFQGHSHNGEGTVRYLRRRHQLPPEAKFAYALSSAWQYGWGSTRSHNRTHNNRHPRLAVIRSTFYRSNGMHWQHDQGQNQLYTSNSLLKE